MDDAPLALLLVIELGLSALRLKCATVDSDLGDEIPLEFRPSGISIHMHDDIFGRQLSLRESRSHQVPIEVCLDLSEAMLLSARMDEGDPINM